MKAKHTLATEHVAASGMRRITGDRLQFSHSDTLR